MQCELLVGAEFLAPLLVAQQVLAGVFLFLQAQVFHGVRRYVYCGVGVLVAEVHSHEQRFLAVLRLGSGGEAVWRGVGRLDYKLAEAA